VSASTADRPGQRLWRLHDFRTLMAGETVSELGGTVGSFALPLAVLMATGSPFDAGAVTASAIAGSIVCSTVAGAWADAHSRRQVMLCTLAVRVLTWTAMGLFLLTGNVRLYAFVPLAFAGGAATALFGSAQAGALKAIVAPRDFPRAVAAIDGRNAAADLVGAPLGGVLVAWGAYLPALVNAGSFLASWAAIRAIRADLGTPSPPGARTAVERIGDGYRYVWRQVAYRSLILQAVLSNFGNNAFTFALLLILQAEHQPPWAIGLVPTGTAVSGLAGALLSGRIVDRFPISTIIIGAETLRFASLVGVSLWHDNVLECVAVAAAGFVLTPAANAAERGFLAIATPDHLQGRVASFDQFAGMSLVPLAPLAAGVAVTAVGPTPALAFFAALVGLAAVTMVSSRSARRLPRVSTLTPATGGGPA
jgi:MFS family permease